MTPVGTQLGPYIIEGELGAGGMGEVYRARDTRLGRPVAIKISKENFDARFEREAKAISALNHPHICTLYDVGPNYLVMELVEGTPLKGPLPVQQVLQYADQMCDALALAHRKGVVHRDLKPGNILVTKQGIKILDFGLASLMAEPGNPALTTAGNVMGTPAYMAPEQWEGKQADARADIYAFGCVLYEMLTGKRAAQGRTSLETLPGAIGAVVKTCLEADPEDRWQAAADIAKALSLALAEASKQPDRHWPRAATLALVVSAAVAIVGIAIALQSWRSHAAPQQAYRLSINPPQGERFVLGLAEGGVSLSPDGSTLAFAATSKGKVSLWLQRLDSSSAQLVAGSDGAAFPFWSVDGRSIGFFAADKLLRAEVQGGSPAVICAAQGARGGAWTDDGRIVFGGPAGLFLVAREGGSPRQLLAPDKSKGEIGLRWPQILPTGRLMYFAAGDKPENSRVYLSSLSDPAGAVQLLTSDVAAVYAPSDNGDYFMWQRGKTLMVQELDLPHRKTRGEARVIADGVAGNSLSGKTSVTASKTGTVLFNPSSNLTSQLTWFDRNGRPSGILGPPAEYNSFRLSHDGRRAVVTRDRPGGSDLWMLESDRNTEVRLTSNSGVTGFPTWFPDGRTLLFAAGNPRNLFRRDSNGSEQRITESPVQQLSTDVSRDGRVALFYQISDQRDLWSVALDSPNAAPKAYLNTRFNESWGRFAPQPTPQWMAYQSDESGHYEVYVDTYPRASGKVQISTGGGIYPQWGGSSEELFYLTLEGNLMTVNLKLAANSVTPSAASELFHIAAVDDLYSPYEAAPDGKRFLIRVLPSNAPLSAIVNWPAVLK